MEDTGNGTEMDTTTTPKKLHQRKGAEIQQSRTV